MAPRAKKSACKTKATPHLCLFCGLGRDDQYGEFYTNAGGSFGVHYFCMIFSSGLIQKGEDHEGLGGFFPQDILVEAKRASRLKCTFCGCVGASIGCSVKKCKVAFHFPCAENNGILCQYFDRFSSFCSLHRAPPKKEVPPADRVCAVCVSLFDASDKRSFLSMPCCKNAWLHRKCIQAQANSAGAHFFRCPLCNNKEIFQQDMLEQGIYIPDRDASWETEIEAFQDLYERHNLCDANNCLCTKGRKHSCQESKKWAIVLCDYCGSKGTHIACSRLNTSQDNWSCVECISIIGTEKKPLKGKSAHPCKSHRMHSPVVKSRKQRLPSPVGRRLSLLSVHCSSPLEDVHFDCHVRLRPSDIVSHDGSMERKRRSSRMKAKPKPIYVNLVDSPSPKKRTLSLPSLSCKRRKTMADLPSQSTTVLSMTPQRSPMKMLNLLPSSTPMGPIKVEVTMEPEIREKSSASSVRRCSKCGKKKLTNNAK